MTATLEHEDLVGRLSLPDVDELLTDGRNGSTSGGDGTPPRRPPKPGRAIGYGGGLPLWQLLALLGAWLVAAAIAGLCVGVTVAHLRARSPGSP